MGDNLKVLYSAGQDLPGMRAIVFLLDGWVDEKENKKKKLWQRGKQDATWTTCPFIGNPKKRNGKEEREDFRGRKSIFEGAKTMGSQRVTTNTRPLES
jgi:hypothetical protein